MRQLIVMSQGLAVAGELREMTQKRAHSIGSIIRSAEKGAHHTRQDERDFC